MKHISDVERQLIDDYLSRGKRLKQHLERLRARDLLRLMRMRLFLTQVQLAKRAGVPQSTVSRVERGELEPTLGLLEKLFAAMECDYLLVPVPRINPDVLLEAQAKKKAKKRLQYLEGTMALEEQKPDKKWMERFLKSEIEEILKRGSDVWEDV